MWSTEAEGRGEGERGEEGGRRGKDGSKEWLAQPASQPVNGIILTLGEEEANLSHMGLFPAQTCI